MTEAQLELLRDKYVLWDRNAREGAMDLRDYNRRCADALKALLGEYAEGRPCVEQAAREALAILNARRDAWTNLTTKQRQLDADGCEVGVSRQAVDETVDAVLHAADCLLAAVGGTQA